ncbi:MAG: hypothetical protein LBH70_04175 [Spirochaetaceae bacterium]|jgi:hypothetical protein|nr:hypothetical protein [Spirochaetaceae bacterium]
MKTIRRFLCIISLVAAFLPASAIHAQTPPPDQNGNVDPEESNAPPALPRSFRGLSLGMDLDALKSALKEDSLFDFRGDRDVSFLPAREQSLVETSGRPRSFARRAFFQLMDGQLFIMAFTLDPGMVDHYSVYTTFVQKYGEPQFLDPKQAVWESGETRVSIERPLTVKYLDRQIFDGIIAESKTAASAELFLREEFLRDF